MSSAWAEVAALVEPRCVPRYSPHEPTDTQICGLLCDHHEVLFGGAAGGGKTDWLLMAALQYVDVAGYSAVILRRTHPQLSSASGLIARSHEWLSGSDAKYSVQNSRWTFPSGATLGFGACQYDSDRYTYQGAEYQFVGFDELTQFSETIYRYLFSRLRRRAGVDVPLRMRTASNPGGTGHDWVKTRFLDEGPAAGRIFIPSKLADNPHLDAEAYLLSLSELDPVTRRQLLDGDWSARDAGGLFRREWLQVADSCPAQVTARKRYWDLAATAAKPGTDPDWSVGALMSRTADGLYYIEDVQRFRGTPQVVEARIKQAAAMDGAAVPIVIEQEPGSSGKIAIAGLVRSLAGHTVQADRATGSKTDRARPLSSQCEAGNVRLVRGGWLSALLDEFEAFPFASHDDQVDACSGAFAALTHRWGWDALYPEAAAYVAA